MRYKAYISCDIEFLRFRVAEKEPNDLKLMQQRFRNVSVITARNAQRDRLNEQGTEWFAVENGHTLTTFYSINRLKDPDDGRGKNYCGLIWCTSSMLYHIVCKHCCGINLLPLVTSMWQ
jgi:hypothetical protein